MKDNGEWRALSLEELLEIFAAPPSNDEDEVRRAVMKKAVRFRDEARRILLQPHASAGAERHDGLMEFIACTSKYLEEMGAGREVIDKLAVYYVALDDLDDGVVRPILRKKDTQKPPMGSEIWRLRGMCAVALEYLVAAKEPVVDAAKTVARIPGIEKLLSGRAISTAAQMNAQKTDAYTSVIKWRTVARSGKKMDETLRMVWGARKTGPQEFRKEATRLIEKIRRELRTLPADV
jgi:hypothetical protein